VLTVTAADSKSIYGPLSAPIAVLIWLYLLSIAVLIGAAVNAAFDTVFPQSTTMSARLELVQRLKSRIPLTRERSDSDSEEESARQEDSPPHEGGAAGPPHAGGVED